MKAWLTASFYLKKFFWLDDFIIDYYLRQYDTCEVPELSVLHIQIGIKNMIYYRRLAMTC